MKYKLIDLGKGRTTAYIVTPEESLMFRGGHNAVVAKLDELRYKKIPFFGSVRRNYKGEVGRRRCTSCWAGQTGFQNVAFNCPDCHGTGWINKNFVIDFVGNRFSLGLQRGKTRSYYHIYDLRYGFNWKFRRLPDKWPKEISIDPTNELLVASDFLEESGFLTAANFIRKKVQDAKIS